MILVQHCPDTHGTYVHLGGQRRGRTAETSLQILFICSGGSPTPLLARLVPAWLGRWEEHGHGTVAGLSFQLRCGYAALPTFATRQSLWLIFRELYNVEDRWGFTLWRLNPSGSFRLGTHKSLLKILSVCCWLLEQVSAWCTQLCSLHHCSLSPISHCQR